MRTEDRVTIFFYFSPEYLHNSALPSQAVSGRKRTNNEIKKHTESSKIFQKISVKTPSSKYILYLQSPFLWTVLWDENHDICQIQVLPPAV